MESVHAAMELSMRARSVFGLGECLNYEGLVGKNVLVWRREYFYCLRTQKRNYKIENRPETEDANENKSSSASNEAMPACSLLNIFFFFLASEVSTWRFALVQNKCDCGAGRYVVFRAKSTSIYDIIEIRRSSKW